MKRILSIFIAAIAIFLGVSCTSSLPAKFTKLADKVEKKGATLSEDQWDALNDQFEEMVEEYTDHYSSFSRDEKKQINKAIARYSAAAVKYGISDIAGDVMDVIEDLPSTLDDLIEGLGF